MFADLALASVAVIKPLKETILMHKLDAPATRTRIPEWILGVTRVPAYPANVLFLLLVVIVLGRRRRRRRRRRGRFDLLSLRVARRRHRRGRGGGGRTRGRGRGRVREGLGGDRAPVEGRRWLVSDLHDGFKPNRPGTESAVTQSGSGDRVGVGVKIEGRVRERKRGERR